MTKQSLTGLFPALLLAGAAHADMSSTITAVSNYEFRGRTESAGEPALQVSLDWSGKQGLYAGAWSSNVDFRPMRGNFELDPYAGWRTTVKGVSLDLGASLYTWHPANDPKFDYAEVYGSIGYKMVSGKVYYAWDYANSGKSAYYIDLSSTLPMPAGISLLLHAGYSGGDYWADPTAGLNEYFDYSVGASKPLGNFVLALNWIDGSDFKAGNYRTSEPFSSKATVVISIATTLPWAKQ